MNTPLKGRRKYSIKFTVGSMFLFATTVTACVAIGMQYYFGKQMSQEAVLSKLTSASTNVSEYLQQVETNATSSVKILRGVATSIEHAFTEVEIRDIFSQILSDNPLFYSLYFGRNDDRFFQVINLESSPIVRERIKAAPNDRWVVIKIFNEDDKRTRITNYYTDDFSLTKSTTEESNYYPTRRPWYVGAEGTDVFKTEPYLFKHLKITGQTYSIGSPKGAIGIDVVLSAVNQKITATQLGLEEGTDAESFIFNSKGEVIASNRQLFNEVLIPSSAPLAMSEEERALIEQSPPLLVSNQNDWGPYDYAQSGMPKGYAVDVLELIADQTGLTFELINGFTSVELAEKYRIGDLQILHSVPANSVTPGIKSDLLFEGQLAIAAKVIRKIPKNLNSLTFDRIGVVGGFGMKSWLLERYPKLNIVELASLDEAKESLMSGELDYLIDTYHTLSELNELVVESTVSVTGLSQSDPISFHLYMKEENQALIAVINQAIAAISPQQRRALKAKWLDTNQWRGSFVPYPELYQVTQQQINHDKMIEMEIEGERRFVFVTQMGSGEFGYEYFAVVVPNSVVTEQVIPKLMTSIAATALVMFALMPLAWRFSAPIVKPIRALRLETKKVKARKYSDVGLVNTRIKEVYELSESIAKMGDELQQHEKQREEFVEAFIKLIAQAIDDKSPYTAGHCNRVPEIGMLLAKAAEESSEGKFKDFCFANDAERREFRIAAWLHDCGKITTPEHIVDKGTKLEANYNRIHEVRMRFEVLLRDAEIEYLKTLQEGSIDKEQALSRLNKTKKTLQDDFEFIARSNVGGEFMGEAEVERIQAIALKTWKRHFDDSIGLSPFEEMSKVKADVTLPAGQSLPVEEPLLSDKPEHIHRRVHPLEFEPHLGIKVDVPEYQYNLGEVYNLSISRGTLTAEDRFKINEHMISGIKMLDALPFPPELSRVPRYASTHHETLKGTGYPRKLSGESLSIPERILVIADIFEALTAADRPYKKAKPISVAIDIMHKMALDEHIDRDLFILFLESGCYLEYAHAHLPSAQIDEVDISQYVSPSEVA
ncbi:transporter substrate-binding domain-containing protein [Vibrio sp. SCSIO 43135]|uniref:HD domain-containing phosphohydrolase n=1 Tax=Vibrio sp. SCSIO 43135 TaxID=2819096 RepID=UPI0020752983|nr:HD domain-containing phosphohydrolase [Vibrio sp. SCSIO 43135]USD42432.1 transporter substrate-binding domain-containing protein [Vibrio sp. SCSIO 43135]